MTLDIPRSDAPLSPVRGLIPVHNARGRVFDIRDLHRWIRVSCGVDKVQKIDLLVHGAFPDFLPRLFAYGMPPLEGVRDDVRPPCQVSLSLRTDCKGDPAILPQLLELNLLDVCLTPARTDDRDFAAWLGACRSLGIGVRVQIFPRFPAGFDAGAFATRLANAGVSVLTMALADPLVPRAGAGSETSPVDMETVNAVAWAAAAAGIETNLFDMPLCHVREELRVNAGGRARFVLDHQQYHPGAFTRAARLHKCHPALVSMVMSAYLGRQNAHFSVVDWWLVGNLVHRERHQTMLALMVLSKVARRFGFLRWTPRVARKTLNLLKKSAPMPPPQDAECVKCSLRRVCDGMTPTVRAFLPGVSPAAQAGDTVPSPLALLAKQAKRDDAVDHERRFIGADLLSLTERARQVMLDSPGRILELDSISPENAYAKEMPDTFRYMTLIDRELVSILMIKKEAPLTVAINYGGGLADYIGFQVCGWIRLLCPMENASHQVVLHVEPDGRYVLLRDGQPQLPVEFEGRHFVPRRLPTVLEVRLSLWGVEGDICAQTPRVWEGAPEDSAPKKIARHSVVVFCTRYARRLQVALQCVAHQEDMEEDALEVVVGYVPGVDATDDVISSVQQAHPGLRIVRCPFTENNVKSKGRILNTAMAMASGDWVTIIDADIALPPTFFRQLDALPPESRFAAPTGRKMLTPEVTARLLLGELSPWKDWDSLLAGPGENRCDDLREGGDIPVGFCQCARKQCLETVRYKEYDHFEGADWEFGRDMIDAFGPCKWLELPVLHLDHGGSQWFGARNQH